MIESIRQDFGDEDLARIHGIETWILNTNTGWLNSPAIPGLRPRPKSGHRYVRSFGQDGYEVMITALLNHMRAGFAPEALPCNMPCVRVTLSSGEKFYLIVFRGDLSIFIKLLEKAAAFFNTELGRFERGKFIVSSGRVYPFSSLGIDKPEVMPPPQDW